MKAVQRVSHLSYGDFLNEAVFYALAEASIVIDELAATLQHGAATLIGWTCSGKVESVFSL